MLGKRQNNSLYEGKMGATRIAAGTVIGLVLVGLVFLASAEATIAQAAPLPLNSPVATKTGLNLREQPIATSPVVAVMPVNARAIVLGGPFNSVWYWLDYNGAKGYANGNYLALVDENYTPAPTETPTSGTPEPQGTTTGTQTAPSPVTTSLAGSPTQPTNGTPQVGGTPTPDYSAPTTPGDYTGLWIGEMTQGGNVRSGPGMDQKAIKAWWTGRRVLLYQAVTDAKGGVWYRVSEPPEVPMYVHSSLIRRVMPVKFEPARYKGRWVNVNLTQQVVTAYEDGKPVMVTLASTGKAKTPTDVGTWKIYWRLPKQTMEGGNLASGDYYKLKDVPYPQYFNVTGESLHGTYWHDNFGRPMSHGCVNLSIPMSGWFYAWASVGTIVSVHY